MLHRVYFNSRADAPLIWSVDKGTQDTEVIVKRVVIRGVRCFTEEGPGDNINSPSAWIAVEGAKLHIMDDVAYLLP